MASLWRGKDLRREAEAGVDLPMATAPRVTRIVFQSTLALALLVTGCATGQPRLTSALFPSGPSSRLVDALWYREQPGRSPRSGVTPVRLSVAPNPSGRVRVGVLEEYPGATGAQWRSSVWIASSLVAQALGRDLTAHRFLVSVGGFIDGPSAGLLIAAGLAAALTGANVRWDVTVTGVLAPDGSAAAVGGLPEKIRAAARAGKRLLGIPRGQALATDSGGTAVDVVAAGRRVGVEVREIDDLRGAYALLTGKRLARPRALSVEEMTLADPAISARVISSAQRLLRRSATQRRVISASAPLEARRRREESQRAHDRAARYLLRGDSAPAQVLAVQAAALARAAVLTVAGNRTLRRLLSRVRTEIVRLQRVLARAAGAETTDGLLLLRAHAGAARARGYLAVAGMLARGLADPAARSTQPLGAFAGRAKLSIASLYLAYAELETELSRDWLHAPSRGAPTHFDPRALRGAADHFASSSYANVEYVEALLLAQVARSANVPIEAVRAVFSEYEHAYCVAVQLSGLAASTRLQGPGSTASALLVLAEGMSAYVESSVVMTKYYSLEADLPAEGAGTRVRRPRALLALLAHAELEARRAAGLARARIGRVPPDALLHYRAGSSLVREGTAAKLVALGLLWRSSLISQVAALVVRRPAAPHG